MEAKRPKILTYYINANRLNLQKALVTLFTTAAVVVVCVGARTQNNKKIISYTTTHYSDSRSRVTRRGQKRWKLIF